MWEGRGVDDKTISTKTCLRQILLDLFFFVSFFLFSFGGGLVKLKDYVHTICLREKKFKLEGFFSFSCLHNMAQETE